MSAVDVLHHRVRDCNSGQSFAQFWNVQTLFLNPLLCYLPIWHFPY